MAEFVIIGLGHFGRAVARTLTREGHSVLAIDRDPERLAPLRDTVESTLTADTTDENVLRELGLEAMDCAVVAMGPAATEASVLTTAILRELEVPRIVARSFDERHARLLLAIGAHEVLNPEEEFARQFALRLAHPSIVAEIRFGDAVIAEVEVPEAFVGQSLRDLELRNRHGISVLAIRRDGQTLVNPDAGEAPASGDVLVLLGPPDALRDLSSLL
jgi:trk system potassium uptake protein TrkA